MDITVNLNLTIRDERTLNAVLARVEQKLDAIAAQEKRAMSKLDDTITTLTAEVEHNSDVIESAKTFITGIPALIKAAVDQAIGAGASDAQLKSITDLGQTLLDKADSLAQAIVSNTPAAQPEAA